MRLWLYISFMIISFPSFAQVSLDDSWSIPDTLNLGVISFPDSLSAADYGSRYNIYLYIPLTYNLPQGDSLEFDRIVAHRANTVANKPNSKYGGKGEMSIKVKTSIPVDKTHKGFVVMSFQTNHGLKVCRIFYDIIGLDQLEIISKEALKDTSQNARNDDTKYNLIKCECLNVLSEQDSVIKNYIRKKHSNGKIWEAGIMLNHHIKHGEWVTTYPWGSYKEIGKYNCGVRQGEFKFWDNESNVWKIENYYCGKRHGKSISYFPLYKQKKGWEIHQVQWFKDDKNVDSTMVYYTDGTLAGKYFFKDGVFDGPQYRYHKNGNLNVYSEQTTGKLNGVKKTYFEDGSIHKIESYVALNRKLEDTKSTDLMHYVKSLRHGVYMSYFPNGQIQDSLYHDYGKQNGKHIQYYKDGQVASVKYFEQGVQQGKEVIFYTNGQLSYDKNYEQGKLHGEIQHWDKDGKLIRVTYYEMGMIYQPDFVADKIKSNDDTVKLSEPEILKNQIGFFAILNNTKLDSLMNILEIGKAKYTKAGEKTMERLIRISEPDPKERTRILLKLRFWRAIGVIVCAGAVGKIGTRGKMAVYTNEIQVNFNDEYNISKADAKLLLKDFGELTSYYSNSAIITLDDTVYDEGFDIPDKLIKDHRIINAFVNVYYHTTVYDKIDRTYSEGTRFKDFNIQNFLFSSGSYLSNILEAMIKAENEKEVIVTFIKAKNSTPGSFMFFKNELLKDSEQSEIRYRIPIAKASFFVEDKTIALENLKGELWYLKITEINKDGFKGILTKKK
jgi:antitoxin component YwqK of YwqJK toxin-antitoxin module